MTDDLRTQLQEALGNSVVIERELGGGGMSRVFVAEDARLHRKVVVKVLPDELAHGVSVERFKREIELAAQLQHPHIVPLLSAGELEGGLPYFTMPYIDGESLRELISRKGELPVPEAARLLREVATALGYAHSRGIVHRDIKPDNILLTGGVALVTDFGVAKALADSAKGQHALTSVGIALGTPAYMAPEQAGADPTTDHRADLYALGVLAYEMLTGHAPFAGRSSHALLAAHMAETPEHITRRRATIPLPLATLVMACLEKRPADRPQDAAEFVRALDAVATPAGTSAPGAPLDGRSPDGRALSGRAWAMLGAAVALVVLAGAGWYVLQRDAVSSTVVAGRVVIPPFENLTGDARLDNIGRIAADWLTVGANEVSSIDVVPATTVSMLLRDTSGAPSERTARLLSATRAGLQVAGSYLRRNDSLVFRADVIDVNTGRVAHAIDPVSGPETDPIAAIDVLRERLVGALASRNLGFLQGMRPPRFAAYKEFEQGLELFAERGDFAGARKHFEQAIALDSTFARAYAMLARLHMNLGDWERADSVLRRSDLLKDGLTSGDRLMLQFQQSTVDGDIARGVRIQQQVAERDSNPLALSLIGAGSNDMLQPRVAIPALEIAVREFSLHRGWGGGHQSVLLAEAYHQAGDHKRELQTLVAARTWAQQNPELPGLQLRAFAGLRDGASALALADTLLRIARPLPATEQDVVTAAEEFRAHGDPVTATRLLAMDRAWTAANPQVPRSLSRARREGTAMLMSGEADSAVVILEEAARANASVARRGALGLAYAARGDRLRARVIADSLGAIRLPWRMGVDKFWRAAILAALGEQQEAVQLLHQAHAEGQGMQRWHHTHVLDSLRGNAAFEALIRPRR
jgi:tetratricopeptide (TPR) repeat protein